MNIKTAGDLRKFLASIMVDIRSGDVDATAANAISKIAGQINQSLAVEVNAALQLERMGKGRGVAGLLVITDDSDDQEVLPNAFGSDGQAWCEQCGARVAAKDIKSCKSRFCSLRPKPIAAAMPDRDPADEPAK